MKKLIEIAMVLALAVMLVPSAVFAGDTVVNLSSLSDRLDSGVTGSFASGTLDWKIDATTGTHTATTTMTNLSGANVLINAVGLNSLVGDPYQPVGAIGSTNSLLAIGAFTATDKSSASGSYGQLSTFINANANGGVNTQFLMTQVADLDVLSANHEYGIVGTFGANAIGTNAAMNLASYAWGASPGGWQEATNPYSSPPLQGQLIEKELIVTKNNIQIADLYLGVSTSGTATMSNSNIWGWGVSENGGSGSATTNYNGGTRYVSATGAGTFIQTGFGANSLAFSQSLFFPGGATPILGGFQFNDGGIRADSWYSMEGH